MLLTIDLYDVYKKIDIPPRIADSGGRGVSQIDAHLNQTMSGIEAFHRNEDFYRFRLLFRNLRIVFRRRGKRVYGRRHDYFFCSPRV